MNNRLAPLLALFLLAACAGGTAGPGRDSGLPSDVNRFLKDRAACADYSDAGFLDDRDATGFGADRGRMFCSGSDADLARLRAKYRDRPDVTGALDRLERQIAEDRR